MAKVTLPNISSGFASTTQLNTALDTIEAEFNNKVLYRDPPAGEPNQLEADIDANDHTFYNVRDAVDVDEVVTLGQIHNILAAQAGGLIGTQRETLIASSGQTVFNFAGLTYYPGANNLSVYLNGSRQVVGTSYNETSQSSITFTTGLNENDVVEVVTNEAVPNSVALASNVAYTPAGTGAVATNVQSKLREFVSVKDFGAVGDGVADDTAAIQDAVNAAKAVLMPDGYVFRVTAEIIVPQGVYIYGHGEIFVDQSPYVRAISLGSDCTVEGVIFRGTGVATALDGSLVGGRRGVAVAGFNVANVKVLGCKFYDFISTVLNSGGGVVQFSSTHNLEVSGCYFDTSNDGFDDISAGYRVGDAVFDRNVSYSNSDIFISISSVGGEVIGTSEFTNTANHIVTNNIHIKNRWEPQNVGRDLGRHGIAAHYDGGLSYLVATNNVIGNVSRHGLYLRGPSTVPSVLSGPNIVSSNYLLYCGSGEASNYCSGIRVETTLPTIIANNYIHKTGYFPTGVAGTSPAYDIESVRGMQDVSISGNTLMHGKDGSVSIRTTVSDRTIRNVVVKDNTIHTSAFGVYILTGHASTVLDDVVISGNYIKLTGATYLGSGGAARAAGIATEIAFGTTSTAYTLSISGNTVTGTGTTTDQYGVALQVSSTQLQKCIIKDNKFHNLEFGFATRRFELDGVSYIPHRIIGTSVRLVRNQFVTCGTALFFSQTAATQLFVADESNVYDGCTSTGIGTAITWNAALEGKCTGRDASGNLLIEYQASAIPTAQQYYQGDRIINTNPVAGGFTGWVCTVSGTPGTWKGYGAIEA